MFFFKQKTAYDMRISDWSSDVCSSDLGSQTAYVAVIGSDVLGMYKFGANYPGLGSHVASATYIVRPAAQGKGIGRALVQHSLSRAKNDGFMAMQFNYVVSSNAPAVEIGRASCRERVCQYV